MSIRETTFLDRLDGSFTVVFNEVSACNSDNGAYTSSAAVEAAGSLWSVRIYPNGRTPESKGSLSCYIANESNSIRRVSFSITLTDEHGRAYGPHDSVGVETIGSKNAGSLSGIGGLDKVCPSKRQESLVVHVRLTTSGVQVNRQLEKLPGSTNKSCMLEESASLLPLLSSGLMSDFTVVAQRMAAQDAREEMEKEDWINIPVHKLILCYRSPVLKAMLQSGMSESTSGELRITDCDAAVVQKFVNFLYAGSCAPGLHAEPLFVLAHRYEMPDLQRLCEHHLERSLSTDNVLHVLSLADLYQLPELRKAAVSYIGRNAAVLLKSRTFLPSLSPQLCQEVLCATAGVEMKDALPDDAEEKNKAPRLH
jgi:hypothetical protein